MKILIIDDEKISRKVLLKQLEGVGSCTAVDDSEKGLKMVEKALEKKKPYDLITLDVSMPRMNGQSLLKSIRKKEKGLKIKKADRTKILMVTSRMNISTIKECIKYGCDGYLSKPVTRYQILGSLGNMGFPDLPEAGDKKGQGQVVAKIIKRFYAGKINLPVLPGIVTEVQDLLEQEAPSIEDLVEIVKKDIMISSKLVSIANSAIYRGVEKADTLNAALVRLGIKAASALISSLVAKDLFASDDEQVNALLEKLWMHSFACACLAKRLGEEVKVKNADALFLMGIVHDIGKMLLIKAIADLDGSKFDEDTFVGIHEIHTTFGAVLLKKMRFPKEFIRVAEFHHWSDFTDLDDMELGIIHLSDTLAAQMGYAFFDGDTPEAEEDSDGDPKVENPRLLKQLGLDPEKIPAIVSEMAGAIKESAKAF